MGGLFSLHVCTYACLFSLFARRVKLQRARRASVKTAVINQATNPPTNNPFPKKRICNFFFPSFHRTREGTQTSWGKVGQALGFKCDKVGLLKGTFLASVSSSLPADCFVTNNKGTMAPRTSTAHCYLVVSCGKKKSVCFPRPPNLHFHAILVATWKKKKNKCLRFISFCIWTDVGGFHQFPVFTQAW